MENYIFYEPLRKAEGDRRVGRARRGERLPHEDGGERARRLGRARQSSYEWQFQQMQNGRGILVFDDGWHKLATALWLFGPIKEVRAWVGEHRGVPDDLRSTRRPRSSGSTRTASAACGTSPWRPTCTCVPTTTPTTSAGRSPGAQGFARVNRCTGRGIQQPSLEVYADGEMRSYHALDDDWASSFRDSGRHWLRWLHTGEGPLLWSGDDAVDVLRFALAVYASSAAGGIGIDPAAVEAMEPASPPDRSRAGAARLRGGFQPAVAVAAAAAAFRRSGGRDGGGCCRGGSVARSSVVALVTWRTARSKAASVRSDVVCTPLTFRTYWRAAASISSAVATGSRPLRVVILRHMPPRLGR